jgi:hypothetical protein
MTARVLLLAAPLCTALALPALVPPPAVAQEHAGVVVQPEPRGTMVALTLRYPAGSAMDPVGEEGTAHLLGRAIEAEAQRRLRGRASRVEVEVGREELLVTLLTPPDGWSEAFREVVRLLDGPYQLSEAEVDALRHRHRERLVFEAGAPVRAFERERTRMVLGAGHPGARDGWGTPRSIDGISPGSLARFQAEHLRRRASVAAVVGPVTESEAAAVVAGPRRVVTSVSPVHRVPPAPGLRLRDGSGARHEVPAAAGAASAWTSPDRIALDRELTSTWMAMAWPFPEGTSPVLLEFLGLTLHETVVASPPEPGFYSAEVQVEEAYGRPVLVFSATVDPRVAGRWEDRILEGMASIADSPPSGAFFELGRRRFRNALLLPLAAPEGRSRWLAGQLARTGEIPDQEAELRRMNPEDLAAAAGAAGPPRVLLLGPLAMTETSRR